MTITMALAGLDEWVDGQEFQVSAEHTIAFAAATLDENPWHVAGRLAPPVYAVPPTLAVAEQVGHRIMGPELAGTYRAMHGEHDIVYHRPIEPGMSLHPRAIGIGARIHSTGTTVAVRTETRDGRGELLNEQWITWFVRGVTAPNDIGVSAPAHDLPLEAMATNPVASVAQRLADDQSYRYARASGDYTAYHVDDSVARAAGFPGVIVHGLCTMAVVSVAAVAVLCPSDPRRLRRLAVRFSQPVLPGETITTRFWDLGAQRRAVECGFESASSWGVAVLRNGLVAVED